MFALGRINISNLAITPVCAEDAVIMAAVAVQCPPARLDASVLPGAKPACGRIAEACKLDERRLDRSVSFKGCGKTSPRRE
jgi:hypothetical protein